MSLCNYCRYRAMLKQGYRKASKQERKKLWDKEADAEGFSSQFGAGVVLVNDKGELVAWLMEVPNHCEC